MVRLQTRTDVLKSDQKVLITELHLRITEVNRLNQAVEGLRLEREKDRASLDSYDRQMKVKVELEVVEIKISVKHMLNVADTAVEKYRYMEKKVKEMELQLERTSQLSTFNHHRLNCKSFKYFFF